MTKLEALDLVEFLFAAYPAQRARLTDEDATAMVAAYFAGLSDVESDIATRAATRAIRVSKFIPTIAEIREEAGVVRSGSRRHGVDAWGDVIAMRAFREGDIGNGFDPLSVQVCRSFGWIETRTLWRGSLDIQQWHIVSGENESADRARFIEAYDKLTATARRDAQAAPGATIPAIAGGEFDALAGSLAKRLTNGSGR